MGIKNLWTVLTPFCDRKPLYELQGKKVAIDLSCWICEAQNIAEYQVQPKMYLRNLYFRTCYLLLMEVSPVFVLEGKAPELKYDTIAARNAIQFKGAKPKTDKVKTGKDRTRFNHVLKHCEEMLRYMGLACIKGEGEAESLCAYLNEDGLVDGCISQDSDCFAYGAQVVYRNFSISTQGAHAASGGAVDVYDIQKAKKAIDFGRNKIIAMALLVGSDYSDGVFGVGKDSVLKFFDKISEDEILERLKSWRTNPELYEKFEKSISDKNTCTSCGHSGKLQYHSKNGCNQCKTTKGCDPFKFKDERLHIKNELNMRSKALVDAKFPDETLINEFLVRKDNVSELNLKWKQPDLLNFVKFTVKFLQWEEIYAFEKLLPILTRWQCLNSELINENATLKGILYPRNIKKARNPKGIPSYEIIWEDREHYFKHLIPEEQLKEVTEIDKLWSTIEPQNLVEKSYPKLVEDFKQSKIKPKKPTRSRKKQQKDIDKINDMLQNTSISEPKPKKARKPRAKKAVLQELNDSFKNLKIGKKVTKVDELFKKAVLKNAEQKTSDKILPDIEINEIQTYRSSTPVKKLNNPQISFDFSDLDDDCNNDDLSDLIDSIISRKIPEYVKENLNKIITIHDDHLSFFISNPVENDMFEKTFDKNLMSDSGESTEEYEYEGGDNFLAEDININKVSSCESNFCTTVGIKNIMCDDSFSDVYVPLYERLKNKK